MDQIGTFHRDDGGNQLPRAWLTNANGRAEPGYDTPDSPDT